VGEQIGCAGDNSGCSSGSANEEVEWNFLGPLRLFEQRDAVVSGFSAGAREWRAGRFDSMAINHAARGSLPADFIETSFALGVGNASGNFRKSNAGHR
jgi:hypothetical protein